LIAIKLASKWLFVSHGLCHTKIDTRYVSGWHTVIRLVQLSKDVNMIFLTQATWFCSHEWISLQLYTVRNQKTWSCPSKFTTLRKPSKWFSFAEFLGVTSLKWQTGKRTRLNVKPGDHWELSTDTEALWKEQILKIFSQNISVLINWFKETIVGSYRQCCTVNKTADTVS
jgi:hypothetical protein